MSRRWYGTVAAISLGVVLGTSIPTSAAARVRMRDEAAADANFYRPRRVVVDRGTRVVWVNRGTRPHTTTSNSGLWDSGTLQPGETFPRRFRKTGVFRYHCEIHAGMTGKIVVVA
jgi:plastocyanin